MNCEVLDKKKFIESLAPKISFDINIRNQIKYIVQNSDTEVGFLGFGEVDKKTNITYITEIFVPEQKVSNVTCEIGQDSLLNIIKEWEEKYGVEKAIEKCNSIVFWGHSHVNMSTNPSSQDDDRALQWSKGNRDFIIRGIFNKRNEYNISVFDFKNNLIWSDIEFDEYYDLPDDVKNDLSKQIKSNVHSMKSIYGIDYNKQFNSVTNKEWIKNEKDMIFKEYLEEEDDNQNYYISDGNLSHSIKNRFAHNQPLIRQSD